MVFPMLEAATTIDHSYCFMPPSWRSHPSCLPLTCPWSLRVGKLVTLAASEAPTSSHIHIILVDSLIFIGFNLPCLAAVSSLHHFASFYIMIRGKFTGRRAPAVCSWSHLGLHGTSTAPSAWYRLWARSHWAGLHRRATSRALEGQASGPELVGDLSGERVEGNNWPGPHPTND